MLKRTLNGHFSRPAETDPYDHIREVIDHAAKGVGIFCTYIAVEVCDDMAWHTFILSKVFFCFFTFPDINPMEKTKREE